MSYKSVLALILQTAVIYGAPLLQPLPDRPPFLQPPQQFALQEQLLALQKFQDLNRLSGVFPYNINTPPPPIVILLAPQNSETNVFSQNPDKEKRISEHNSIKNRLTGQEEHGDSDSIAVEAQKNDNEINPQFKAMLLMPNDGRFSIGGIISAIPFLPIEVNVPDSIAWIYNGISSIISSIGQRFPFRPFRPQQEVTAPDMGSSKLFFKDFQPSRQNPLMNMPILVLPVNIPPMLPPLPIAMQF